MTVRDNYYIILYICFLGGEDLFSATSFLLDGGTLCDTVITDRFHFSLLSLTFSLGSLSKEERKSLSVLCRLLSRGCRRFPSPMEADVALGMLYDTVVSFDVRDTGSELLFRASVDFADGEFLDEPLFNEAAAYLSEALKDPIIFAPTFTEQLGLTLDAYSGDLAKEACEPEAVAARRYSDLCARSFSFDRSLLWDDLLSIPDTVTEQTVLSVYEKIKNAPLVYVCSVGQTDKDSLVSVLDLHFRNRAAMSGSCLPSSPLPTSLTEAVSGAMARVHLGYRVDGDGNACALLATVLGGFASSRLFTVLREEEQLCYSVSASFDRRLRLLTVSSTLTPDGLDKALSLIDRELSSASELSDSLFSEAKDALLIGADELFESRHLLASYLLSARIRAEDVDLYAIADRIDRLTKEDVERAASSLSRTVTYIGLPSSHGEGARYE